MVKLKKIGKLRPKSAAQVGLSRLGIGFEKLDRAVFDPEKAYDKLGELGVKWVRIQSGWQRTERKKGFYDFEWLDSIVDNLIARGLQPWVCLCYGNELYNDIAKISFGAVGCPPVHDAEEYAAWLNYVVALAVHLRGRVRYFEVWNEPDGRWSWKPNGVNPTEYGNFTVATAKAIKEAVPEAYMIGGALWMHNVSYLNAALQTGMGEYLDAISFHVYTLAECDIIEHVRAFRGLRDLYGLKLDLIQGESGAQSSPCGNGALKQADWSPYSQAKSLLRHLVTDLSTEVKFTSYFSCVDMIEALRGKVGDKASYLDYGYFGVLGADFDENGISTGSYDRKPAYFALQSLAALFAGDVKRVNTPVMFLREEPEKPWMVRDTDFSECITAGFRLENGTLLYAYWKNSEGTTNDFHGTVTLSAGMNEDLPVHLIDPMDGSVYDIPEEAYRKTGHHNYYCSRFVIRDYPLFLAFGELPPMESEA